MLHRDHEAAIGRLVVVEPGEPEIVRLRFEAVFDRPVGKRIAFVIGMNPCAADVEGDRVFPILGLEGCCVGERAATNATVRF
jgi:hypothetical protein